MWKYVQSSGDLFKDADYIETGYSGANPEGKNQPDKECQKNVGPIPRGWYRILGPKDKPTAVTLPLKPDDPDHCRPRRTGFLIHGDNETGTASRGCIILSRRTREKIRDSGDVRLQVVRQSSATETIARRSFAERKKL
jgi:hypothetical protein